MRSSVWLVLLIVIGAGMAVWFSQHPAQMGASVTGDTSLSQVSASQADKEDTVSQNLTGTWQSTQDAKFTREFKGDGSVVDLYGGQEQSNGAWEVFTKAHPLNVPFPLADNAAYVQIRTVGTSDTLNFSIASLTPDSLTLTYMDRGNTLAFRRVQ